MYLAVVILTMLVLPVGSVVLELTASKGASSIWPLVGKWFAFWAVGARLFLAGLNQCPRPRYTAEGILGIPGREAFVVVRELGFANLALGTVGLASLWLRGWVTPAAVAGGAFIGLAAFQHLARSHRNRLENLALGSNLFVFAVLAAYCVATGFD
jgi:hypothetical protein